MSRLTYLFLTGGFGLVICVIAAEGNILFFKLTHFLLVPKRILRWYERNPRKNIYLTFLVGWILMMLLCNIVMYPMVYP